MGRKCLVCSHPQKNEIEAMLREGTVLRTISDDFGLSIGALFRHKESHMKNLEVEEFARQREENWNQIRKNIVNFSPDEYAKFKLKYPGCASRFEAERLEN